ncbi:hypothetical protein ILUMI_13902, partial [Ignelater luminosus]
MGRSRSFLSRQPKRGKKSQARRRYLRKKEESCKVMWKDSLWEIMELAGKEEHEIAKTNGDIDADGIPYIT